jgi:hypothetical protein
MGPSRGCRADVIDAITYSGTSVTVARHASASSPHRHRPAAIRRRHGDVTVIADDDG